MYARYIALVTLAALVVASFFSGIASAAPQQRTSPNTIVSNTGETILAGGGVAHQHGIDGSTAAMLPDTSISLASTGAHQETGTVDLEHVQTPPLESAPQESIAHTSLYADTRYGVYNTTDYPNRAMVALWFQNGNGSYRCSGFMISPNTVATAGHCLHFQGAGLGTAGWSYNIHAYPGYTGTSAPYGSCGATYLYSVTGWTVAKNADYDYGVVKLDCTVGNVTGWLGYRWQSADLQGLPVHIQGYPADKGWGQWRHDGAVAMTYAHKTFSTFTLGFEGAPIFDNNLYAVAIFAGTGPEYSIGTRITSGVFDNLNYWRGL